MSFAHHEDSADWCATDVKDIAYTSTMELVLSHHESRCPFPLWPKKYQQAELVKKKVSYADST